MQSPAELGNLPEDARAVEPVALVSALVYRYSLIISPNELTAFFDLYTNRNICSPRNDNPLTAHPHFE